METRHPELSKHVRFEENGVQKGLQTTARRGGKNRRLGEVYQDTLT